MKRIKRIAQIVGGIILIAAGIVMLFFPGQGILSIVAGIMLISPQHGKRVLWWLKQFWRRVKGWWYSWWFKRVVKRKVIKKLKRIKSKLKKKK